MGEKIVIGPFNKGFRNDVTAFNIDNDSFPRLINAYQWRGRVKRKRGTSFLTRLNIFVPTTSIGLSGPSPWAILNIYSTLVPPLVPPVTASIVPGSVVITIQAGPDIVFTDQGNGTLTSPTAGNSGTINYSNGDIVLTHTAGAGVPTIARFSYYTGLPVMGLEEFQDIERQYPGTIAFDTRYSYNILTTSPYNNYNVSYYKNPDVSITLPGYIRKTVYTPTDWNGEDYQQFWTINYQGALWATNGITVPFDPTRVGMQFKTITGVTIITAGNGTTIPAVADITIIAHGLVQGDFVFINEVVGMLSPTNFSTINFQTGYVTSADPQAANVVRVTFPFAILLGAYTSGGIAQYLTNRSNDAIDNIRWYDGDPTDSNAITPSLTGFKGWVNFMPPLSREPFSIGDLFPEIYYLVGARMIAPFKDRLLFIGPVVQSSTGVPHYLQDTVVYSQNGTPYYTASFSQNPSFADTPFFPILVPVNQTASPAAYWGDQTGFGGFITAGVDQQILTTNSNQDVLLLGFTNIQTKLIYSGNDIVPFNFFIINSELGSGSTFSGINLDKGAMTRGERGIVITDQNGTSRFDLEIPDEVFQIRLPDNGAERVTAQRDFINEWVYFTYPVDSINYKFPTQTLQYNYRDQSWAIFRESYTHYGQFREQTGYTWANIGERYATWNDWNDPWSSGASSLLDPKVIAGNQQGFIVTREKGTNESNSLSITSFAASVVTCIDHCLNVDDFIIISGAIGTISSQVNGKIFQVGPPITTNSFGIYPAITGGTYLGGGLIKRMYIPQIQTKQFPPSWGMARKTRLGPQQYLLSTTSNSQVQLLIYLSQDGDNAYNNGTIVPDGNSQNDSLVFSSVLYTCPESTNLGLTPANTNLQQLVTSPNAVNAASPSQQIWHRVNTSLLGDTVQVAITLSEEQMRSLSVAGGTIALTNITLGNPTIITVVNNIAVGSNVRFSNIIGTTQLNFNATPNNFYNVIARSPTQITIDIDSTLFGAYVSGGLVTPIAPINQFAEIELHGAILDITASAMLS